MIGTNQIDIRAMAENVVDTLNSLESYLTTAMNPNRVALSKLEMEPMGWTKLSHHPRAFEIWEKQHRIDPDDHLTIHHLAIMHHARAFELEMSKNPAGADKDWKIAMDYWHRLHCSDAFWDDLARKACSGAPNNKGVDDLRADLPKLLLGIHYDIALDEKTREQRPSRAKFHIALAQNSSFDERCRASARAAAYSDFIKTVPNHVWVQNELREEEVAKGTKVIEAYLLFDPGCQMALEDALRLQQRMQQTRNIKWRSLDDKDGQRIKILEHEKRDFVYWQPYFKQLIEMREQLSLVVRDNVAGWYFTSGDSFSAYDKMEEAVKCFEIAVFVCADEDERKKYRQRHVLSMALVARKKAGKKDPMAKSYCDRLLTRNDLTVQASLVLAQAYLVMFNSASEDDLELLDIAEGTCLTGLAIDPDFDDLEAEECKEHLKSFQESVQKSREAAKIRTFIKQAQDAMERQGFAEAVKKLDHAEKLAKSEKVLEGYTSIYWLRAQAHLALEKISEAKRDAESFGAGLDNEASSEERAAAKRLEDMVAEAEAMKDVGPLLDRAKAAIKAGNFSQALPPLNDAAKRSPHNMAVYFLRCQANTALKNFVAARGDTKKLVDFAKTKDDRKHAQRLNEMIIEAETAAEINGLLSKARQSMEAGRFKEALTPLNEAARKAPRNYAIFFLRAQAHLALGNTPDARRDAQKVADLAETEEDRRHAHKLNDMITQGGAAAALKQLLDQAQDALQNERYNHALESLDKAAKQAPNQGAIYFLRAQARWASKDLSGALEDIKKFEQLAGTREEKEAVQRLKSGLLGA